MTKPVPRIRKQKARRRAQGAEPVAAAEATPADPNALEIVPASASEREERKARLKDELRSQQSGEGAKMSGKKRKRLDKYIDTKLKKEENLELIKKLAAQKVDTSLFQSSKKLGRGSESKRERLGRILRERKAGIGAADEEEALWERQIEENEESSSDDEDTIEPMAVQVRPPVPPPQNVPAQEKLSFGSGLKRPLEVDESGNALIQRRKRSKKLPSSWAVIENSQEIAEDRESEWEGFDSNSDDGGVSLNEDSENNTSDSSDGFGDMRGEEVHSDLSNEDDEEDEEELSSETSMDESEDSSEEENENAEDREARKSQLLERSSAFKAWASAQRNEAVGFTPSTNIGVTTNVQAATGSNADLNSKSLPMNSTTTTVDAKRPSSGSSEQRPNEKVQTPSRPRHIFNVPVERAEELNESRLQLPVVAEEQKIMEAVHNHDTVILWGATGSGKTTQIPQFLFEAGYGTPESPTPGLIGITQPRRVAAVSMAKRVAFELGQHSEKVSYQIRFDSTVSDKTSVKFMTDGVLIREISQDFTLSKYSAIVIDEAHERSVNTDILIGMLSRIVETRSDLARKTEKYKPLKLIIMSATLRTADMTQNKSLFRKGIPPMIQAEGRQYPVTVHFAKRTQRDYVDEMFRKVSRGHKKLPQGAILVFLTGQNEISHLSKRLKQAFPATEMSSGGDLNVRTSATEASIEDEDIDIAKVNNREGDDDASDSEAEIHGLDNDDENEFDIGVNDPEELLKVHVLPLYSQLPTDQQMRVFEPPPPGSRMIVLATNVAETSLTIPDVRYVFDCGRAKEKHYDKVSGVQSFDIGWISKASASQRTGRAGRTGPGHCYRLYSSAVFERDFTEFTEPEISRTPIEGVVLQLKSMGIPNVANFPFPTPPERASLIKAEQLLEYLGAIVDGKVTRLGKELAIYPLSPRLSRILCMAAEHSIINQAVALVAVLAVADIFIPESQLDIQDPKPVAQDDHWTEADNQEAIRRERRRKEYNSFHGNLARLDRTSDALKLLTAISDFNASSKTSFVEISSGDLFRRYARVKALQEAVNLYNQLLSIMSTHKPGIVSTKAGISSTQISPKQAKLLNQLVAAGFIDQIAIRADMSANPPRTTRTPKRATDVPYTALFPSWTASEAQEVLGGVTDEKIKVDMETRLKSVYIHPSSVLAHSSPASLPQFLIYSHLSRAAPAVAASSAVGTLPKTRIHPLTPVSAEQIVALATGTPLLEDGKPVGRIETMERDEQGRERRRVTCLPFLRAGKKAGGNEWPLAPARRVIQRREKAAGWVVESVEK